MGGLPALAAALTLVLAGACDLPLEEVAVETELEGEGATHEPAGPLAGASTQDPTAKESDPGTDLHLAVLAPRERVELGEPVVLIVTLQNRGPDPVQVEDLLHPGYGFLEVRIQGPDGKPRAYRSAVTLEGRGVKPVELPPGGILADRLPLHGASASWILSDAGSYSIEATYHMTAQPIGSEPVRITVRKPADERGLAAANLFVDKDVSRFFLLSGGGTTELALPKIEAILEKYPASSAAGYAYLARGRFLNRRRVDASSGAVREADPRRALPDLERAVESIADPVLWTDAAFELQRCLTAVGGPELAAAAGERARERYAALVALDLFDDPSED